MSWSVKKYFSSLLPTESHERTKWLLMTATFFLIIAAYTITKELKDSIFVAIVGDRQYIFWAKLFSIGILIPAVLLYSKLVDSLKRYRLLSFYCFLYGVVGLLFALLLGHPTIGLPNTNASSYRIFGWLFYFFIEGYAPFVVSVFWSFANSITSPEGAKKNYGFMVAGSKIGGMLSAAFAYLLLTLPDTEWFALSGTAKHQLLLAVASLCLMLAPLVIYMLMKKVSGRYLHGYEAVYKVEKKRSKEGKVKTGIFSGLVMLIRTPYVFGIFYLGMCYELIYSVLSYQRVGIAQEGGASTVEVSTYFFKIILLTHALGFLISLFGTRSLLRRLGEKRCLILIPIAIAFLFAYFKFSNSSKGAFAVFFVLMRAIHYGFSYPIRESLYIPTVKELKFKTKSWIDAFGTKFSKLNGWLFNYITTGLTVGGFAAAQGIFFGGVLTLWILVSWLLGNRFEKAIKNKEVIGLNGASDGEGIASQ